MSPQWSDFVLAAHIPDSEADVLVLHSLHIETYIIMAIMEVECRKRDNNGSGV